MNTSTSTKAIAGFAAVALLGGGVVIGMTVPSGASDGDRPSSVNSTAGTASQSDRERARQIARDHVAEMTGASARASWTGREDDFGARWEIEVTSAGREYDVYVSRSGAVVKVITQGLKQRTGKPAPAVRGSDQRKAAARAARLHMQREYGQPARVTWTGREDDFGARWEIEVTLADGREFDVYVGAGNRIITVR